MLLDDVIRYCFDDLFFYFDYDKYEAYTIKVTRTPNWILMTIFQKPHRKNEYQPEKAQNRQAGALTL